MLSISLKIYVCMSVALMDNWLVSLIRCSLGEFSHNDGTSVDGAPTGEIQGMGYILGRKHDHCYCCYGDSGYHGGIMFSSTSNFPVRRNSSGQGSSIGVQSGSCFVCGSGASNCLQEWLSLW